MNMCWRLSSSNFVGFTMIKFLQLQYKIQIQFHFLIFAVDILSGLNGEGDAPMGVKDILAAAKGDN
jgi:hypothetical protein